MAVAAGAAFAAFEDHPLVAVANPVLLVVGLSVSLFPIYYVFPDLDLSVREVVPGVLIAAVGWAALQSLFQFYVLLFDKQEVYGVIGGVLLLLTWLYLSGFLLLVGGVVNAVLAGRTGAPGGEADGPTTPPAEETSEGARGDHSARVDGSISPAEYERLRARYGRLRREYDELAGRTVRNARTRSGDERPGSEDG